MSFEEKIPEYIQTIEKVNDRLRWIKGSLQDEIDELEQRLEELYNQQENDEEQIRNQEMMEENNRMLIRLKGWAALHGIELEAKSGTKTD